MQDFLKNLWGALNTPLRQNPGLPQGNPIVDKIMGTPVGGITPMGVASMIPVAKGAGALGKALSAGRASAPIAQDLIKANSVNPGTARAMSTKFGNPVEPAIKAGQGLERRMTAGAFGGNPNIGGVRPPVANSAPIVKSPTGQVTNNFANTTPGNTIIRDYPQQNAGSLEDLIQASMGRMPAQSPAPVQPNVPVHGQSIPLNNVTNNFANTSPGNAVIQPAPNPQFGGLDDMITNSIQNVGNNFGANSSPIGGLGQMGNIMEAPMGGMPFSPQQLEGGLQSTGMMGQRFLNGGFGW